MFHAINSKINKLVRNQIIYSANDDASSRKFRVELKKFNKVLLITGKSSYIKSGSQKLIQGLLQDSTITVFNEFDVNPDIDQIKLGSEVAKNINPDAIIAIGGGSVIDAAKIIHTMFSNDLDEKQIFESNQDQLYSLRPLIPLIAIPTTAGTGSESTHFAVLYKNNKKFSVGTRKMLPSIVYLDSDLCLSNSSYQNACSGFDALAQAIESYWSKNSNFISRYYSKKSIQLILENFDTMVSNPSKSYLSSMNMLNASNYAGKAINITKTTGPHALSYGITKSLSLPHGHAVALTLGAFFIMHNLLFDGQKKQLKKFKEIENFIFKQSGRKASEYLYEKMGEFKMEFDIKNLGLNEEKIESLIKEINLERMSNHPIKLNAMQLKQIFFLIPRKS